MTINYQNTSNNDNSASLVRLPVDARGVVRGAGARRHVTQFRQRQSFTSFILPLAAFRSERPIRELSHSRLVLVSAFCFRFCAQMKALLFDSIFDFFKPFGIIRFELEFRNSHVSLIRNLLVRITRYIDNNVVFTDNSHYGRFLGETEESTFQTSLHSHNSNKKQTYSV